jgi:magnesium chelatase subunit D
MEVEGEPDPASARVAFEASLDSARRSIGGKRQETVVSDGRGRYARSEPARAGCTDIALDATIRAAAPHQSTREGAMAINVSTADVQTKVRKRKVGASVVFCVDGSGSMGAADRMDTAKAAVLDLLVDAYQRRDRVGLVSFRGDGAEVVLAPTGSVELAQLKLKSIPVGGATPLAAGMVRSLELLEGERRRDPDVVPWLVLVTDGRANVGLNGGLGSEDARAVAARVRAAKVHVVVIDTGSGPRSVSGARDIATAAGGEYVRLQSLDGPAIAQAVRSFVAGG